jgi:spore coat polysaccharide biosynthesis predicted glycosyltransferase SpsG
MSASPSVLFLTVAGAGAGLGHVKRCVALGSALAGLGASVRFAVAGDSERLTTMGMSLPGLEPLQWTRSPGRAVTAVARSRADIVVVDAYDATDELLRTLRSSGGFIAAIDDLADRELPVDLVVNHANNANRRLYADVPGRRLLLGPRYALLDEGFVDVPGRVTRPVPSRVLVTLGGEDAELTPTAAVAAVEAALPEASIDVVGGVFARSTPVRGARVKLHQGLPSLRALLLEADFAVTAAGMTLYECLAAGTPAVAVPLADNQKPNFDELTGAGLVLSGQPDLAAAVERLFRDAALRGELAARGRALVDGRGAARVAAELVRAVAAAAPSAGPARGAR